VCPFDAIRIVNVPSELKKNIVHRFNSYGFRLYRLPELKPGNILGLIGPNGIGKTTVIQMLSDKLRPNFEQFDKELIDKDIIKSFRGNNIQKYLEKLYSNKLKVKVKPQYIETILQALKDTDPLVKDLLAKYVKVMDNKQKEILAKLQLDTLMEKHVKVLSGGELQRLMCAITALQKADVYIFDEPCNYLDVRQRLIMADVIRSLVTDTNYIIVIEHDLSIVDYVADYICIMYGKASAYGIVSTPHSTLHAINIFFDGYIPAENMRFRDEPYHIKDINDIDKEQVVVSDKLPYESFVVEYPNFNLRVNGGTFPIASSITVVLGQNGTGKTTFLNNLAKKLGLVVSFKEQYLEIERFKEGEKYPLVQPFLINNIRDAMCSPMFVSDVINLMSVDKLYKRHLNELSLGELQRVMLAYSLGRPADVYFIDEPSAFLDIEQRVSVTKMIKRFMLHNSKVCFVVEHDIMMAVAFAMEINSQIIVFEQEGVKENIKYCSASGPMNFHLGINKFLQLLNITFRSEPKHNRPRINKLNSQKDTYQKQNKQYYA
jgi:ATP-binding cassette, sub-family E, member 1